MDRRKEIRRWLALRDREGLTYRELSQRSGVPVNTLAHWAWKLKREERGASTEQTFVEVVPRSDVATDSGARIEIQLRCGRRVVADASIEAAQLARVVSALERC